MSRAIALAFQVTFARFFFPACLSACLPTPRATAGFREGASGFPSTVTVSKQWMVPETAGAGPGEPP